MPLSCRKRRNAAIGPAIKKAGTRRKCATGMATESTARPQSAANTFVALPSRAERAQCWKRTWPAVRFASAIRTIGRPLPRLIIAACRRSVRLLILRG